MIEPKVDDLDEFALIDPDTLPVEKRYPIRYPNGVETDADKLKYLEGFYCRVRHIEDIIGKRFDEAKAAWKITWGDDRKLTENAYWEGEKQVHRRLEVMFAEAFGDMTSANWTRKTMESSRIEERELPEGIERRTIGGMELVKTGQW